MIKKIPLAIGLVLTSFAIFGCASVIQEGDPMWRIATSKAKACNPVDGRYLDGGLLFEKLTDSSTRRKLGEKFSITEGFRSFPYVGLPSADFIEERRRFNRAANTKINRTAEGWEVLLYGGDELLYAKTTILFSSEYVGCDSNNSLVLREFSIASGSEGTGGTVRATERIIEKTENGSLRIKEITRQWSRTMNSPPNRETEKILTFERYNN